MRGKQTDRCAIAPFLQKIRPLGPVLSGVFVFLLLYGPGPLDPCNLNWWGGHGDPLQAWIGWTFFRNSPWTFPLALNPSYGLELNSSIIYTDSIPLLALGFKLLSPRLPQIFQYLGWWTLACLACQGYFGWKLATLAAPQYRLQWLGSLLFIFSPILFFRLDIHFTLVGQFLVLAALFLCLAPPFPRRYLQWLILICLCSFIHAYLLCMVLALWAGWVGLQYFVRHARTITICGWLTCTFGALFFCCWLLGYFATTPGEAGGFGIYKMNLLSLFDPDGTSWFLPDLPSHPGEIEGYNYLGAGYLVLLALCLVPACKDWRALVKVAQDWWPLLIVCCFLVVIAVTNVIGFGPYILKLPTIKALDPWLQVMFRASGRFFWPVYYLGIFVIFALIVRYFPLKYACLAFAAGLAIQILDMRPLFMEKMPAHEDLFARHKLTDDLWGDSRFTEIRLLPLANVREGWEKIGIFAALHGLRTNHVYVSRIDSKNLEKLRKKEEELIASGNLEPNVIYITDEETFKKLAARRDRVTARYVDGFPVLTKKSGPNSE